ncbi:hypothetical protein CERSUDRAFT_87528 [Gelatoporia subvermispora B]|uniref:FAD/NAD(P)-binding domain-containing protein n=1 Tax=Ceriporiopsis subvermispora (strain B) TaxID=914234 RepID=M2Q8M4_CERS8|nr:hypothetical protein CERSUDRAFT_87528 [Gelatoporia subvermispora B]
MTAKGGKEELLVADVVLVAVGRRPVAEGLSLDKVGGEVNLNGCIVVDAQFMQGIKCISDATFRPMLAHKAEEGVSPLTHSIPPRRHWHVDGIVAVELIKMGRGHGHINYYAIPTVMYTYRKSRGSRRESRSSRRAARSTAKTNADAEGRCCTGRTNVDRQQVAAGCPDP